MQDPPLECPSWTYFCEQCKEKHCEKSECDCGACLYKYAKQIPDDMYPLFKCKKCGRTVFWD